MINDTYQNNLEKDLNKIYNNLKNNLDISLLDKLKKENEIFLIDSMDKESLIEYYIFDNKVTVDKSHILKYQKYKDARLEQILSLIQKSINYAIKNNLKVPNTTLYIWISDRFPYIDNIQNFPVYVFARPIDLKLPIFPDNTFECLSLDKKYSEQCNDWDYLKKLIINKCKNKTKKKELYFKGTPTTLNNSQIREKLEIITLVNDQLTKHGKINDNFYNYIKYKLNKIKDKSFYNYILSNNYQKKYHDLPLNVTLDAWNKYTPIYSLCEYMYLLNLPGHYQWSNRLKYLFLMKSHVININVKLISEEYTDEKYITFIDYIINKNNYHEIVLKYYRENYNLPVETNQLYMEKNIDEFNKFIRKLSNIYKKLEKERTVKISSRSTKKKTDKINQSFDKINQLTNERIYHYIYTGIVRNAELFDNLKK